MRVPISLHPLRTLAISCLWLVCLFLTIVILMGMRWCHVGLTCISRIWMTDDAKHLFMCSLALMCVFFGKVGEVSLQVRCLFLNWVVCIFLLLSFRSSLCILDINSLSDIWFSNISSHFTSCLFIFLMGSLAVQRYFISFTYSLVFLNSYWRQ